VGAGVEVELGTRPPYFDTTSYESDEFKKWAKDQQEAAAKGRKSDTPEASVESAPKKKQKKSKVKENFIFEAHLADGSVDVREGFATAKQAAERAWTFCEEHDLEMPSGDWYHGEESCYNTMTRTEDSEPDQDFIAYMTEKARCGVALSGSGTNAIKITPS
jgi:hypothetical protein